MNKFIPWIDQDHINNTQGYSEFSSDTQRSQGFQSGTPASSIRVNTALRQANLVAAALMNVVAPDNQSIDYRSTIGDIMAAITNGVKGLKVTNAVNADNVNLSGLSADDDTVSLQAGTGTAYTKKINNVPNVKTSINGKNITDIFEADGITAKNATIAQYASSDTSKGTIEERLTNLGFKQGSITLESGFTAGTNSLIRYGNVTLLNLTLTAGKTYGMSISSSGYSFSSQLLVGTIPENFRPINETVYPAIISLNCRGSATSLSSAGIDFFTYSRARVTPTGYVYLQFAARYDGGGIRPNVGITYDTPVQLTLGYMSRPIVSSTQGETE